MNGKSENNVKILQDITIKTAKVHRPKYRRVMTKTSCPICKKLLSLRQANRTTAIYLCDDLSCPYPFEEHCPYPAIIINREWKDINKPPPDDREWTEDDWLNAMEKQQRENAGRSEEKYDAEPTEIFDMIDSYVENQSRLVQNEANSEDVKSLDDFLTDMFD